MGVPVEANGEVAQKVYQNESYFMHLKISICCKMRINDQLMNASNPSRFGVKLWVTLSALCIRFICTIEKNIK